MKRLLLIPLVFLVIGCFDHPSNYIVAEKKENPTTDNKNTEVLEVLGQDTIKYRYGRNIEGINPEEINEFYMEGTNNPIVGYWYCKYFNIEVAIIPYNAEQKTGEMSQFIGIITRTPNDRFKLNEQILMIDNIQTSKVLSGRFWNFHCKETIFDSPKTMKDTLLFNFLRKSFIESEFFDPFFHVIACIKNPYRKVNFYLKESNLDVRWTSEEENYSLEFEKINDLASNSTQTIGSGFIISETSIATAFHIIEGQKNIIIISSENDSIKGDVISKDRFNDIAIIETVRPLIKNNNQIPYTFSSKNDLKTGSDVYTIGYPFGDLMGRESRISEGIINSLFGLDDDPRTVQISNPIQPGNSGGLLIAKDSGDIIGIVISALNATYIYNHLNTIPQNVNFAIKSVYLKSLIEASGVDVELKMDKSRLKNKSLSEQFEIVKPYIVKVVGY